MPNKPLVSVIIPAYNEEDYIGNCIDSLLNQSYKNFEVIVVDDGSTDKTPGILRKYPKIKLLEGQHKGPGFSRNLGSRKAKGEILVFIDADMTFDKDYLANLVNPLIKDQEITGTTHDYEEAINTNNRWSFLWGRIRVPRRTPYVQKRKDMVIFRAIRKKAFLKMGGFDPVYGYADDQTFWFKYKLLPAIAKNTTCYHVNPETLSQVYSQSRWIGASMNHGILKTSLVRYTLPLILVLLSPLMIIVFSLKKCLNNGSLRFFFPWMFIFMSVRYFGTIAGMIRKSYFKNNTK